MVTHLLNTALPSLDKKLLSANRHKETLSSVALKMKCCSVLWLGLGLEDRETRTSNGKVHNVFC